VRKLTAGSTKQNCCYNPRASVAEFARTFTYEVSTPTPTPTATATPSYTYFDIETFTDGETGVNTEAATHSAAAPVTWGAQAASPARLGSLPRWENGNYPAACSVSRCCRQLG